MIHPPTSSQPSSSLSERRAGKQRATSRPSRIAPGPSTLAACLVVLIFCASAALASAVTGSSDGMQRRTGRDPRAIVPLPPSAFADQLAARGRRGGEEDALARRSPQGMGGARATSTLNAFEAVATANGNSNMNVSDDLYIDISDPVTCELLNITFDPSKGRAPYTVFVGFSDWYGNSFSVPDTYADPTLALWLVQFPVPVFIGTPQNTRTPSVIVSVIDSTGMIANSSAIKTVTDSGKDCARVEGKLDFVFWSPPASPSACGDLQVVWNTTSGQSGPAPPLNAIFLPERSPPQLNAISNPQLPVGNTTLPILMAPGTAFMMTMTDNGLGGGVSGRNVVGGSEYQDTDCLLRATPIPALPRPTSTRVDRMLDFTSAVASLTTSNGVVATVTVSQAVKDGKLLKHGASTGSLILYVAVGVGLGLGAAFIAFCCWRKRQKRKNFVSWDLPPSMESTAHNANAPLDPRLYRDGTAMALGRTGSTRTANGGSGAGSGADGRSSTGHLLAGLSTWLSGTGTGGGNRSFSSLDSSDGAHPQSNGARRQAPPSIQTRLPKQPERGQVAALAAMQYANSPHAASYTDASPNDLDGGFPRNLQPSHVGLHDPDVLNGSASGSANGSPDSPSHRVVGQMHGRDPFSSGNSVYHDVPLNGGTLPPSSASQRRGASNGGRGYGASAALLNRQPSNSSLVSLVSPVGSRNVSAGSNGGTAPPGVVRHRDAGLLMDDLDETDPGLVELPPDYNTILPGRGIPTFERSQAERYPRNASTTSRGGATAGAEGDIANQDPFADQLEGTDESQFWQS